MGHVFFVTLLFVVGGVFLIVSWSLDLKQPEPPRPPESVKDMVDRMIRLSSSSSTSSFPSNHEEPRSANKNNNASCALLFYGLPRAFRRIVLPSIVRNILLPNARYQCDVYVYFHALTHEDSGRSGQGGCLDLNAVYRLRSAVSYVMAHHHQQSPPPKGDPWPPSNKDQNITAPPSTPRVVIANFTNADFAQQQAAVLHKIRSTVDPTTNLSRYVPWMAGFTLETVDNVIRMYHAIQGVWELMIKSTNPITTTTPVTSTDQEPRQGRARTRTQKPYDRVAIFRIDVFYATPIDIFHYVNLSLPTHETTSTTQQYVQEEHLMTVAPDSNATTPAVTRKRMYDADNRVAVVPGFARYPVNDRMMYGPYEAMEIYASRRFDLLDRFVQEHGQGLHPETFLAQVIFPEIRRRTVSLRADVLVSSGGPQTVSSSISEKNHHQNVTDTASSLGPQEGASTFIVHEDASICFVRARADESVWINDCKLGEPLPGLPRQVGHNIVLETLDHMKQTLGASHCTRKKFKIRLSSNITFGGVVRATCQTNDKTSVVSSCSPP